MVMRRLTNLEAGDILTRTTLDEVPEGYRNEVYVEEVSGDIIENWFIGGEGALSYSGTILTLKQWNEMK